MASVRMFLAVEVAEEIRRGLVRMRDALAGSGAAVRWVRDDGLHATVKFLGAVAEDRVPAVETAAAAVAQGTAPLLADVRGVGAFPSPARPRVVWAGLACPGLAGLAAALDGALAPLGFVAERRPFAAHITLGRVKGSAGLAPLVAALRAHAADAFGRCPIAELIGFRSDLRRDGAVYTKLWTIPFGGEDR
jgi:2'-5' RNA ligase